MYSTYKRSEELLKRGLEGEVEVGGDPERAGGLMVWS